MGSSQATGKMKHEIKSTVAVFALAVAFLAARQDCMAQRSAQAQDTALLEDGRIAAEKDSSSLIIALEPKALAAVDSDARRRGDRLALHLSSGLTKTYDDSPECKTQTQESKCVHFTLVSHVSAFGVFVMAKLYYESVEYLLVDDQTGNLTTLRGFPLFSHSGSHFIVLLMNDQEIGFGIQIWRREGRKFIIDWVGSPYIEGIYTSYKLVRWRLEDKIELRAENSFEPPKPNVQKYFDLCRSGQRWNVVEVP